jgi:5-methylcytosine-specific restriction endonuclease McrA
MDRFSKRDVWQSDPVPALAVQALRFREESRTIGTVLVSTTCHYCGKQGKMTQDHIVPRTDLPPGIMQPYWFRSNNIVPACSPCNNKKGCLKSDCECDHCRWAWASAKALWQLEPRGIIYLVGAA